MVACFRVLFSSFSFCIFPNYVWYMCAYIWYMYDICVFELYLYICTIYRYLQIRRCVCYLYLFLLYRFFFSLNFCIWFFSFHFELVNKSIYLIIILTLNMMQLLAIWLFWKISLKIECAKKNRVENGKHFLGLYLEKDRYL